MPLSGLLVVTLGGIQADFHRFWLAQQSMDVCPTNGTPPACRVNGICSSNSLITGGGRSGGCMSAFKASFCFKCFRMCDHRRVFDTGHDLDLCAASFTGFDVDTEQAFQSLHPRHGPMPLFGRLFQPVVGCNCSLPCSLSPLARGCLNAVFTVRGEYTVETG